MCKIIPKTGHPVVLLAKFGYPTKGDDIMQMKIPEVINKWLQMKKNFNGKKRKFQKSTFSIPFYLPHRVGAPEFLLTLSSMLSSQEQLTQ